MPSTPKVLAQISPSANTLSDAYVVPAATTAAISTVSVCNLGVLTNFRISIAVAGAADVPKQYIFWNVGIDEEDSFFATAGITVGAGDVVRVWSGTANLSFGFYGVEVT